ncbi:DUF1349 domain-containing protein [Paenibacillus yanchengensis]|uniref:DUF1349 domain-containing protein n=1 Tax=Paenibacillus yanchengensis TaxID=2035833 RepID=A0ABW4YQ40_9BACL
MKRNVFLPNDRTQLKWINEPSSWKFNEQDQLVIDAPAKADFFCDPAGQHFANSAPFLYLELDQSFELTTELTVNMKEKYDSGCLMIMIDANNWAKLCYEFNGKHASIVTVVTRDGVSDDCYSEQVYSDHPFLKMTSNNKVIHFYFSEDGIDWTMIRYFALPSKQQAVKAGVVAQSPQGPGCHMTFCQLQLETVN